jgi:DNA-directed RNA polymerase beta subunit
MIVSANLSSIPFLSSTDSTRASMSAKQIQQALTSPNTEIPYVIGSDYHSLTNSSRFGIILAEDDGKVLYKNPDLLIVYYKNLQKTQDFCLSPIKKTTGSYGTTLRYCIDEDHEFKKGEILANYDCFHDGVPAYGYNTFTAYMPFFGMNHEDAVVISESFSEKAQCVLIDKVYIPIYEYTLMQEFYKDTTNSYIYFPAIGQQIKEDVVCCLIAPRDTSIGNFIDLKNKIQYTLKNMSLSNLLSFSFMGDSKFAIDKIKTKVENGYISGIKIHRFKKANTQVMIDSKLERVLDFLYRKYCEHISDTCYNLQNKFNTKYIEHILKKYYIYIDKTKGTRGIINLNNLCYLLEFEISKTYKTIVGDKIANRYANKGVVSLILPDELRPIALQTNKSIDLIFNPFGVFSRMNFGQLLEGIISKTIMMTDQLIKNDPKNVKQIIQNLNENIIKYIDVNYYTRIHSEIIDNLNDPSFNTAFVENIQKSNLFIESPSFAEINIKSLLQNIIPANESVLLKKSLIKYMRQKLNLKVNLPEQDTYLKNIFCVPIYIQKLSKLVKKIINARDFGSVKSITRQPTKGRARGGGSRLGQMELEALLASGCDLAVKEILTVKSDWTAGKKDLVRQLIVDGRYNLPEHRSIKSRTKEVVDIQLKFLKE